MATPRHSEQNWTGYLYNKPLEYTQLVLSGEIEQLILRWRNAPLIWTNFSI